jgi:hypothetical protein
VILLVDCAPPADIAAAFAHGLAVVGCNTLDVGDPPAVAGIVGLMLSCNPVLEPDEIRPREAGAGLALRALGGRLPRRRRTCTVRLFQSGVTTAVFTRAR